MAKISKWLRSLIKYEEQARVEGFKAIAGIDEAGRGPLAGPVTAAACVIPEGRFFLKINDSKKLTEPQREELFNEITQDPNISYGIGIVSHEIIDAINIYQATIQAMLEAIEKLAQQPHLLLVDGLSLKHPKIPSRKIIKGDEQSQSIMAASILAKVTRDRIMVDYDKQWPEYGFKKHKGYGTERHLEALKDKGPSPIHRKSFAPVREWLNSNQSADQVASANIML